MEVDKIGGNNCLNCVKNGGNMYQPNKVDTKNNFS